MWHVINLQTLTERHIITFWKHLINLLYQPTWAILVKLGELNMKKTFPEIDELQCDADGKVYDIFRNCVIFFYISLPR
jgi:hypothetical protein